MQFKDQNKRKAVTFSYDDGVTQDIRLIELLNKYGLKCTFNLNSGRFGMPGLLEREGQQICHYKLAKEDVPAIYAGHEIAAHTVDHPMLPHLSKEEVIRQVEQDRLCLSELAGYEVVGMAYPGGGINFNDSVAQIIRENTGIQYSRTTVLTDSFDLQPDLYCFKPTAYHMDFERLMRLGEEFVALEADKPQIFYIWGHSYEMDYASDCWVRLEEFFRLISGRTDIFYGTNAEVLL